MALTPNESDTAVASNESATAVARRDVERDIFYASSVYGASNR